VLDLLDVITIERKNKLMRSGKVLSVENAMRGSFVDLSQSHSRRTVSHEGEKIFTMTTSTMLYSYYHDSIILPEEVHLMHGFSRSLKFPDHLSQNQIRSLVGNGMAAPCLAQTVAALYVALCNKCQ